MSVVSKHFYNKVNKDSKEEAEVFEDYWGVENFCKNQKAAE
jgi:hypothetical protein